MDVKQIDAVEILKIDDVELYYTDKTKGKMLTKGSLFLLYSQEFNWFILKINHFTYGLSRSIPVLASRREPGALRAYVLVDVEGYFVIKVNHTFDHEDLERLEYVLKEQTQFAYKEGEDSQDGFPLQVEDGTVNMKTVIIDMRTKQGPQNTAQWLYEGGKSWKKTMVDTAETVSLGMNKLGVYIKDNHLKKDEVQISPQTVSKVSFLNSATGMVASMSTLYIKGLMSLGTMIAQKIETKFEKIKNDRETANLQEKIPKIETIRIEEEKEESVSLPYAAVHCAITIWQGMIQALDIIREGFTQNAGDLVGHRYGAAAGEIFKAGAGVVGNMKLPGKTLLKVRN